ncbi:hypothetical protein [Eubacterium aggregans]|uniref:hypothetical protein n=1 Tax=Eubacterium aggregans TaxID=81409 RepID=UPI003F3CFE35
MKINVKEQKDSALVWVLVITVIFGILEMAIGWVALSMNKRSFNNFELTQSYFTVRSAVDSVLENLNHYDTSFSGSIKTELEYKTEIEKYNNDLSGYLYKNLVNGNKSVDFKNFFNLNSTDKEVQTASNQMAGYALTGGISKGHVVLTA